MKTLMVLVAVLLSAAAAAKVPLTPEVTKVTVPLSVDPVHGKPNVEIPVEANVVEVQPATLTTQKPDAVTTIPMKVTKMPPSVVATTVGVKPVVAVDPVMKATMSTNSAVSEVHTVEPTLNLAGNAGSQVQGARKLRSVVEESVLTVGQVPVDPEVPVIPLVLVAPDAVKETTLETTTTKDTNAANDNSCDLECTKFDLNPICASNGDCLHEFPNKCVMDVFTCQHPSLGFKAANDERCRMHWLKQCTDKDLME